MAPTRPPKLADVVDDIHPADRRPPSIPSQQTNLYVPPSASKVNELPAKDKPLALSAMARTTSELATPSIQAALQRIAAFKAAGPMPVAPAPQPQPGGLVLGTPKPVTDATKARAQTLPGYPPSRSLSRRAVSAPLPPLYPPPALPIDGPTPPSTAILLRSALDRPVPNSPFGNAFDGQHFWQPQFSPQVAVRPVEEERDPEILRTPTEAVSRAAYLGVREEVDVLSAKLFHDAAKKDEHVSRLECDVEAAWRVFAKSEEAFRCEGEKLPDPHAVSARLFAIYEDERRVLESFGIRAPTDLLDTRRWMRVDEATGQVSTILDSAREAMAMLRDRRKTTGLELSAAAYAVVHALVVLEEKKRKLEQGRADEDSDDELNYLKFLKSISEEVGAGQREVTADTNSESAASAGENSKEKEMERAVECAEPPPPHDLSQVGWDEIKGKGKSAELALEPILNPRRRSLEAEFVAPEGWSGSTAMTENDDDVKEATSRARGVSAEPRSNRTSSGGRAGDLEKRRERGIAPSMKDLASWAEELKDLEKVTPPKNTEDVAEDGVALQGKDAPRNVPGDRDDVADEEEQIGLAITTDD